MQTSLFDYQLPRGLIAQEPVEPRDASRLMVLHRQSGLIEHRLFRDLPGYLQPPDVLVLNHTRVIPARLVGRRANGGPVELLLVRRRGRENGHRWEALVRPARRARIGCHFFFGQGELEAVVEEEMEEGRRVVRFEGSDSSSSVEQGLRELGMVPLPPYIHQPSAPDRYQTVFARHDGSVAAPTAGLHFTPELLESVQHRGVETAQLVLHVGPGTFRPVRTEEIEAHRMDKEFYQLPQESAETIRRAETAGGRVVAVGTTVVRTLETVAAEYGAVRSGSGWTGIFICPGHRFRVVDALVTNFHLPRSTLLMLVCAFAGRELVLEAYRMAVKEGYRFYSFGDAMLIV